MSTFGLTKKYPISNSAKKILVIGDVMLDEYLIGDYKRNSPEAAVPIINYTSKEQRLGGAANVALNLKSLGLDPILVSIIGDDEAGQNLIQLCRKNKISHNFIKLTDRPTTVKQRIVDLDFKQYLRVDYESTEYLNETEEQQIHTLVMEQLEKDIQAVILQDYNKGLMTTGLIQASIDFCESNEIPSFADPKHHNYSLLAQATVFKPNLKELLINQGLQSFDIADIKNILETDNTAFKKMLFLTLGAKGIYYKDKSSGVEGQFSGFPIEDPDVSGAGDTVLSALVYSYLLNPNAVYMAEIANKAGAAVCAKKGVSLVTASELEL